jgi:hypothetical protein
MQPARPPGYLSSLISHPSSLISSHTLSPPQSDTDEHPHKLSSRLPHPSSCKSTITAHPASDVEPTQIRLSCRRSGWQRQRHGHLLSVRFLLSNHVVSSPASLTTPADFGVVGMCHYHVCRTVPHRRRPPSSNFPSPAFSNALIFAIIHLFPSWSCNSMLRSA